MRQFLVDAFTDRIFAGNPAAVCLPDRWIPDRLMQEIAEENRLSETAFLVRENGTYQLRWFTPEGEIDLCGHATLAAAYVVMRFLEPSLEMVSFDTKSGILTVRKNGGRLEMDLPSYKLTRTAVTNEMIAALGVRPLEAYLGRDLLLVLEDAELVRTAAPDPEKMKSLDGLMVHITAKGTDGFDCVSRSFGPKLGIAEDPVCGSGHCHIVPYWSMVLGKKEILARQLSKRGGTLFCEDMGGRVKIAGNAVLYAEADILSDEAAVEQETDVMRDVQGEEHATDTQIPDPDNKIEELGSECQGAKIPEARASRGPIVIYHPENKNEEAKPSAKNNGSEPADSIKTSVDHSSAAKIAAFVDLLCDDEEDEDPYLEESRAKAPAHRDEQDVRADIETSGHRQEDASGVSDEKTDDSFDEAPALYLEDIAQALDGTTMDWSQYLNRRTGKIVGLATAADNDTPEQKTLRAEIASSGDYVPLPNQFEIHEKEIMENFANSLMNDQQKEALLDALHGRQPFGTFRNRLNCYGVQNQYFMFKMLAFCRIAKKWCDEKHVSYEVKSKGLHIG
jgi:PhzF family phenazine biosynthesis protein